MQLRWLRSAHGLSAAAILVVFLAPHIANHLTTIWSTDLHKAVMRALRAVYRQSAVQSILIGLLLFQVLLRWGFIHREHRFMVLGFLARAAAILHVTLLLKAVYRPPSASPSRAP